MNYYLRSLDLLHLEIISDGPDVLVRTNGIWDWVETFGRENSANILVLEGNLFNAFSNGLQVSVYQHLMNRGGEQKCQCIQDSKLYGKMCSPCKQAAYTKNL